MNIIFIISIIVDQRVAVNQKNKLSFVWCKKRPTWPLQTNSGWLGESLGRRFIITRILIYEEIKIKKCIITDIYNTYYRTLINKKPLNSLWIKGFRSTLAVWTRLELATSGVTGRHSNQLNYQTKVYISLMGINF